MRVKYLQKENLGVIDQLLKGYMYNDYRHYLIFKKVAIVKYLFKQIEAGIADKKNDFVLIAQKGRKLVGIASLVNLPEYDRRFGFKIAEIKHLIITGSFEESFEIKQNLVSYLLEVCKRRKIIHLFCRTDTSDTSSVHVLQSNMFRIMETAITYIFNNLKHKIPPLKEILYNVRFFKKEDLNALLKLAENRFLSSRYYFDMFFPREKINNFYQEWIRDYCSDLKQNKVFVAEKNATIVGFLMFRENIELGKLCQTKVFGNGLAAVYPIAKGAYPLLLKAALAWGSQHFPYYIVEFDTQINNYEVVRILQRLGLDFIRSKYTFHRWLVEI